MKHFRNFSQNLKNDPKIKEKQQAELIEKLLTTEESFYHEGKPHVSKRVRARPGNRLAISHTFGPQESGPSSPKALSPLSNRNKDN